jgi:hypothetical protein
MNAGDTVMSLSYLKDKYQAIDLIHIFINGKSYPQLSPAAAPFLMMIQISSLTMHIGCLD